MKKITILFMVLCLFILPSVAFGMDSEEDITTENELMTESEVSPFDWSTQRDSSLGINQEERQQMITTAQSRTPYFDVREFYIRDYASKAPAKDYSIAHFTERQKQTIFLFISLMITIACCFISGMYLSLNKTKK